MKTLTKRLSAVALVLAALVSMTTLTSAGAADGAWTGGPVTIRVELDLPENSSSEGPLVQQVTNVIPGDQVELTSTDVIDNPSGWCGTLWVDIDPAAKTVQVSTGQVWASGDEGDESTPRLVEALVPPSSPVTGLQPGYTWDGCDFSSATVTISGAGFDTLTLLSDDLWSADAPEGTSMRLIDGPTDKVMNLVDVSASEVGDSRIAWAATPADEAVDLAEPGAALFAYTLAEPEAPTTTVTKPDVEAETTTPPSPTSKPAVPVTRQPTYTG